MNFDLLKDFMDRLNENSLETLTSSAYWPYPTYGELLFGVR